MKKETKEFKYTALNAKIYICAFLLITVIFAFFPNRFINDLLGKIAKDSILIPNQALHKPVLYIFYYVGIASVVMILKHLYCLVKNIENDIMFTSNNISYLKKINIYVATIWILTLLVLFIYQINLWPIIIIECFIECIISIIIYVFRKAKLMKDDLDLTI